MSLRNVRVTNVNLRTGKSLVAFDDTARTLLLGEEAPTDCDTASSTDDGYLLKGTNSFSGRHFEGSNLSFPDGVPRFETGESNL